jgi:hypothetical protein
MKRKVRLALLGVVLHGGAHAEPLAAQSAPVVAPAEAQAAAVQPVAPSQKKSKAARRKKSGVVAKPVEPPQTDPVVDAKPQDSAQPPTEQVDQSVQLKGVRG